MEFQEGNQLWRRRESNGRKRIFETPEDLWNAAVGYFEWSEENPLKEAKFVQVDGAAVLDYLPKMRAMTESGLCLYINISTSTFNNYKNNPDFMDVTKEICAVIYNQKFSGAAGGFLNANIIARDLGLAEKKEHTGKDGGPIEKVVDATLDATEAMKEYMELMG